MSIKSENLSDLFLRLGFCVKLLSSSQSLSLKEYIN